MLLRREEENVRRGFHFVRGELQTARELAEQYLALVERIQFPIVLLWAHYGLGETLMCAGEFATARAHLEQGIALYDPQQVRAFMVQGVQDPGVACLTQVAQTLWYLGYPDQAQTKMRAALSLAQELAHPFSQAWAFNNAARLHLLCWEERLTQEWAEASMRLSEKHGFPFWETQSRIMQGWALVVQGQEQEGLAQIHHGLFAWQATGAELFRPLVLALLAEACGRVGQVGEGLSVLVEALAAVEKSQVRFWEAELYRLYGELSLRIGEAKMGRAGDKRILSGSPILHFPLSSPEEACQKAIEIARQQQAKSWELRAATSLARLWQSQGKTTEARDLLAPIYNWFTEGFDTADLKDAKALLDQLA